MDVILNVYDLPEQEVANNRLYGLGAGFYHSGVQCGDMEYSFSPSGVQRTQPLLPDFGRLREQIAMGRYEGNRSELAEMVRTLHTGDFRPGVYNVVHKNCNDFSEAFCRALLLGRSGAGAGPRAAGESGQGQGQGQGAGTDIAFPDWINRAARIGRSVLPLSAGAPPTAATASATSSAAPLPAPANVAPPTLRGARFVSAGDGDGNRNRNGNSRVVPTSQDAGVGAGAGGSGGISGFFSWIFGGSSSSSDGSSGAANSSIGKSSGSGSTAAPASTAPKGRGKTEAQRKAMEKLVAGTGGSSTGGGARGN